MLQDGDVGRDGRGDAIDHALLERTERTADGRGAVVTPAHQLADQVVVVLADLVAGLVTGVEPGTEATRRLEFGDRARRREEGTACRILRVDTDLDGVASHRNVLLGEPQSLASRHPELRLDQVDAGDEFGDRVFDLEPSVHLEVPELAVLVEELDGAGVDVVAPLGHGDRGLPHGFEDFGSDAGGRGLFDQLLMTALGRAVAGPEVQTVAVLVGQYLDLDMAGLVQIALEIELAAPEVVLGLSTGGVDRRSDIVVLVDDLHAASSAAECRLDRDRPAVLFGEGDDLSGLGDRIGVAGNARDTHVLGCGAGRELVSHHLDRLRAGTDEGHTGVGDRSGEVGILAEESVAGVQGLGSTGLEDLQDLLGVEVALGSGLAAECVGLVGQPHVERIAVEFAVDGNRRDTEVPAGADHPNRDLTSVGDKNLGKHRHSLPDVKGNSEPDRPARVSAAVASTRFARVGWVPETGSTNDDLAAIAGEGGPEQVLVTDLQTAGRGRRDRTWHAPAQSSVLMSFLIRDRRSVSPFWTIGAVALAAAEAVSARSATPGQLKWPNDLLVGDRKIAGILAQVIDDRVIVGMGMNVNWPDERPDGVPDHATALNWCASVDEIDREALVVDVVSGADRWLSAPAEHLRRAWIDRCATIGRRVRVELDGDELLGRAVDVERDGAIVIAGEDGRRHPVSVGDVVHLRSL